jgi:hypothetical protein
MLRKILLSCLAALGVMSAATVPVQAHPHHSHHFRHYHYRHYYAWPCRTFVTWTDASNWISYQRQCGYECYYEWNGPQCVVYYGH